MASVLGRLSIVSMMSMVNTESNWKRQQESKELRSRRAQGVGDCG